MGQIFVKLANLSVEAGISKSKKKACRQGDDFTRRIHQTHIVSLLVIVGVTGEVDDHEGVGHEAHQAAQEHHRVAAVPQRELETQEPIEPSTSPTDRITAFMVARDFRLWPKLK